MNQPYYSGYYPVPAPPPASVPENPQKRQLRRDANYIGLTMLAVTAAMQLVYTVVTLFLVSAGILSPNVMQLDDLGMGNTAYLCYYACIYTVSMAAPAVLVAVCCGRRYFPLSPAEPCAPGVAFGGTLAAIGGCMLTSMVVSFLLAYLSQFGVPMPEQPQLMVDNPTSLVLGLIVMAVLPALLEELVFRGYVLRALRPYGDLFAVLVSAALFGLIHSNIQQVPFAFVVGILLGWLYVSTNNIWLPVTVHFCNNAVSVLLEYLGFSLSQFQYGMLNMLVIGGLIALGIVGVIILCVSHREVFRLRRNSTPLSMGERVGTLFTAPAFVIALIVFVLLMWVVLTLS